MQLQNYQLAVATTDTELKVLMTKMKHNKKG